ncbi:sugar phosphate isomerase/epimerase [Arthrobacter sp. BHU FT2]|nr:sugar phosphate isomerase/epimerase [Arthrobacter sp. BHU FT2]
MALEKSPGEAHGLSGVAERSAPRNDYSLAHLTVLTLDPPAMVEAAAEAGYRYVGFRLNRTTQTERHYPLITDRELMARTKSRLASTGVEVLDIEVARLEPDREPEDYLDFLRTGAELGARHVVAQAPDPNRERAIDRFGRLCDLVASLGMTADLEFMPWQEVPDLTSAAEMVRAVGRPSAGILVDLLHFARSGSSLEELASLPREWFRYAQVCDAPRERPTTVDGLIHTARRERAFPGDGGIDVRSILATLPPHIPYALEIPSETLTAEVGPAEYARRAIRASQKYLDAHVSTDA